MGTSAPVSGLFFFIWFVLMIGMIVGWIVFLVAIWRGMKAHESIANTATFLLDQMARRDQAGQHIPPRG